MQAHRYSAAMRASPFITAAFAAGFTIAGAFSALAQTTPELVKQIGDWNLYCDPGDAKPKTNCTLRQYNVVHSNDKKYVEVMIAPEEKDGTVPLAFRVPESEALKRRGFLPVLVDQDVGFVLLQNCRDGKCLFATDLAGPLKQIFFNAKIVAADVDLSGGTVMISMAGIHAAMRELNAVVAPPPP
jgi:invasion protein IalB